MRRLSQIEKQWGPIARSTIDWPAVNTIAFSEENRAKFNQSKRALIFAVENDLTRREISLRTGVSINGIKRLIHRAFTADVDGKAFRFLACIPNFRIKKYQRTVKSASGRAGRFTQFLDDKPKLQEPLDGWASGEALPDGTVVRGMGIGSLWDAFFEQCEKLGIDTTGYPFTNGDGGREAVRRYCKAVRNQNFIAKSTVEQGDEAGRLAAQSQTSANTYQRLALRPYDRVQLDGHRIDLLLCVEMTDDDGDVVHLLISRVWLLVALDCASRAVLGYSLSLLGNYSSDDVLQCVSNSLEPWSPKTMPTPTLGYAEGAGLPSGVIDECAWRVFDALQFDNAFPHLSEFVQHRFIGAGIHEVQTNRPKRPRSNSLVERFFKTFEEMSLHRLPMTTGSGPSDPRRKTPEKAAIAYEIQIEDLELITDITLANYNATPHESLYGRSPLDYIRLQLRTGRSLPRYTTSKNVDGLALFERDYRVTIRMSSRQGHRPFVKFHGVRYSGTAIEKRADLANQRAIFRVNIRDIRQAQLFLENGTLLGTIEATSRWMVLRHSIQTRRAINRLVKQNKLSANTQCPLSEYLEYLRDRASSSKKARSKWLHLQRSSPIAGKSASKSVAVRRPVRSARSGWVSLGVRPKDPT